MERAAVFERGPRFFEQDGETMFEFRIDAGNVIGPRKATEADVKKHPKVWDAYVASQVPAETLPEAEAEGPVEEPVPEPQPKPKRGRPAKVK